MIHGVRISGGRAEWYRNRFVRTPAVKGAPLYREDGHPAFPTDIDETAPVISRNSIAIAAPLQLVWEIHTDIAAWPQW